MTVHLLPIPVADLRVLAESGTPQGVASRAAEVSPANLSSARVVEKLGFERSSTRSGESREEVVEWILRRPHA